MQPGDSALQRDGDVLRRTYADVVVEMRCWHGEVLTITTFSTSLIDPATVTYAKYLATRPETGTMIATVSVEETDDGHRFKAECDALIAAGATDRQLLDIVYRAMDVTASTVTNYDASVAEMALDRAAQETAGERAAEGQV